MDDRNVDPRAVASDLLAAERSKAMARVASLTGQFTGIVESSGSNASDDEHDPEGQTIAFERAQVDALLALARGELAALDRAEQRLRDGSYGRCERCGREIAAPRLLALPAASTCIHCAVAAGG
ncbi:MAG: TraR/DksA family transcriptional regulator [Sciscionella sp.]